MGWDFIEQPILTSKLATTSMAKLHETNKAVTDASKRKISIEIMKNKNKQIMQISNEGNEQEKGKEKNANKNMEDDSKMKKKENKNFDGFLAGSGNCRSQFFPMLY